MKKLKKILSAFLILIVSGALVLIGIDTYVRMSTSMYIVDQIDQDDTSNIDYILVLGAGIYPGGEPSPMLKERLDKAIELYVENPTIKILVSGDHMNENHDEVNAMKNYMTAEGVPSNDIFMDHAGISTYDSLYRARHIFGAQKVLVVTQKYHLYRALYIGKKLGLDVLGANATKTIYSNQTYRDVREFLARIKDFVKCSIAPASKFTGDAIPVFEGGNITNDKDYFLLTSTEDGFERYINTQDDVSHLKSILENLEFTTVHLKESPKYTLSSSNTLKYDIILIDETVYVRKDDEEAKCVDADSEFIHDLINKT